METISVQLTDKGAYCCLLELEALYLIKVLKIKLGYAITGAIATVYSLTLVTRNTDDFKRSHGLQLLNPWL